jgi:hypothetical protein
MKITYNKVCIICGGMFSYQKYPSTEKFHPKITCSEKCRLSLVSKKLSGRFIPNGANEKKVYTWETIKCKYCKNSFTVPRSRHRIFCSTECKSKWQTENLKDKNNPNWKPPDQRKPFRSVCKKVRRDLIAERKVCENCLTAINLQVHHKDRNRGNNSSENKILLCKSCHADLHEKLGQIDIARFIRSHPQTN